MKPLSFRNPALPIFRGAALPALLLSASALAGCAHLTKPPEIALDDVAAPAVLQVDPPAPVQVVELPTPLPLPGQLKPLPKGKASPESFRVAWIQRRYENGSLSSTERWTAILSVVLQTPHDADKLRKNPLGVFVNSINWSKELGQ